MGPLLDPNPRGSLWLYEPESEPRNGSKMDPSKLRHLELKGFPTGHDFHPLGLEVYPSYAGNASNLYVVNHARERTVIEQFLLSPSEPDVATYIRTLTSPYFLSANSLALTSPDSFYVTNDHLITRRLPYIGRFLPLIESVFAFPLSFVSHITLQPPSIKPPIQSHQFSVLFMPFSNGISLSPNGTHVAIASTTLGKVFIYTRNPTTNSLTQIQAVPVPFVPDNIQYTHDGSAIIVAGHPHFPTLANVASKKTDVAPSWVVSITITDPDVNVPVSTFDTQTPISANTMVPATAGYELKTLLQSDGSGFSTSSTGLLDPVTGALYVSGLYAADGLIICNPTIPIQRAIDPLDQVPYLWLIDFI